MSMDKSKRSEAPQEEAFRGMLHQVFSNGLSCCDPYAKGRRRGKPGLLEPVEDTHSHTDTLSTTSTGSGVVPKSIWVEPKAETVKEESPTLDSRSPRNLSWKKAGPVLLFLGLLLLSISSSFSNIQHCHPPPPSELVSVEAQADQDTLPVIPPTVFTKWSSVASRKAHHRRGRRLARVLTQGKTQVQLWLDNSKARLQTLTGNVKATVRQEWKKLRESKVCQEEEETPLFMIAFQA